MAPTAKTDLAYLAQEKTLELSFVRDEDERPKVAYNEFSNEVPVISLAGIHEVGGRREEICKKIVEACKNWGIFQVVDHGVDQQLMAEMTRLAKEFFILPLDEKFRFDMSGGKRGGFNVSSHLRVNIFHHMFIFLCKISHIFEQFSIFMLNRFGFIIQVINSVDDLWDMTG